MLLLKKYILGCFVLLQTLVCSAQNTFQKTFSQLAYSAGTTLTKTKDGGFLLGGKTYPNLTSTDKVLLFKTDSLGNIQWSKTYAGNFGEYISKAIQTTDGGYIFTGTTYSDNTNPFGNAIVIKLDSIGNIQWKKHYGVTGQDDGYDILQTTDGGYALLMLTNSFGAGGYDMVLLKLSASGSLLWITTVGGTGRDTPKSLIQTSDGGYAIAAHSNSWNTETFKKEDFILCKINALGKVMWTKRINRGDGNSICNSIIEASDKGFVMAGWNDGSFGAGLQDIFIVKTDSSGNNQWMKNYGGYNSDFANNIIHTTGGYIVTGYSKSTTSGDDDAFIFKIDYNGSFNWYKRYGSNNVDRSNMVIRANDGGFAMIGLSKSFGSNMQEFYFVKTDSVGNSICNSVNDSIITNPPIVIINQIVNPIVSYNHALYIIDLNLTATNSGKVSPICSSLVGIDNFNTNVSNNMFIYPNPSVDNIRILNPNIEIFKIDIYDSMGKRIKSLNTVSESNIELSIVNWETGIYYFQFFKKDGCFTQKLIKTH